MIRERAINVCEGLVFDDINQTRRRTLFLFSVTFVNDNQNKKFNLTWKMHIFKGARMKTVHVLKF